MNKRQQEKKKMNTYLKYGLTLLACMALGAAVGFITGYFGTDNGLEDIAGDILQVIRSNIFWILLTFFVVSMLAGEYILSGMRKIGMRLQEAEDEETDLLEYRLERMGSAGMISNNVFMVLSILVLATGYSMKYIEATVDAEGRFLLAGMIVFILENVYLGIWQLRYVKVLQRIYPEKKGDPASRNFQKQWLESCDEAEQEMIYQSCYKTYMMLAKMLPILTMAAMLSHLIWNTGIMAVIMVSIIWLVTSITYCRYCLTKKGEKIR